MAKKVKKAKTAKTAKKKKKAKSVFGALDAPGPRGKPGADSLSPVSQDLVDETQDFYGALPQFWGRYFKDQGNTNPGQYHANPEAPVLRASGIRLLPIGRQTNEVGGTKAKGEAAGRRNARAIIEMCDNIPANALVFLDVEQAVSLSTNYYLGWAHGLQDEGAQHSVSFMPAVYGSFSANTTWNALSAAVSAGAPCGGVWIARYVVSSGCPSAIPPWSDSRVTPAPLPSSIPVLAWQYAQNCNDFDCNQCNPTHETTFLPKLITP